MSTPSAAPAWRTINLDERVLRECVASCRKAGVTYGLGAKAPRLDSKPGADFQRIDCSGFVRWALYQASDKKVFFPDGSVQQHDFVKAQGFKTSTVDAGKLKDGRVRIAFLTPHDGGGIGHVALILNGYTLESHGGRGPSRRQWTGSGWQSKTHVYVLEMDEDDAGDPDDKAV